MNSSHLLWSSYQSPLGPLTLLARDGAICRLLFAPNPPDPQTPSDPLAQPHPPAQPDPPHPPAQPDPRDCHHARPVYSPNTPVLAQGIRELAEYFNGERTQFSLPITSPGSGFIARAQAALHNIAFGHSITYRELATLAGNAKAVRAAGTACATNPVPIIVACHRVVRSDGSLGNYLAGTPAKAFLLNHEREVLGTSRSFAQSNKA